MDLTFIVAGLNVAQNWLLPTWKKRKKERKKEKENNE